MSNTVLKCYSCSTFQSHQQKKAKKWTCKMCNEKQSFLKVYFQGSGAECRNVVQKMNMTQGEARSDLSDQAAEQGCTDEQTFTHQPNYVPAAEFSRMSKWSAYLEDGAGGEGGSDSDDQGWPSTLIGRQSNKPCTPQLNMSHKLRTLLKEEKGISVDNQNVYFPERKRSHLTSSSIPEVSENKAVHFQQFGKKSGLKREIHILEDSNDFAEVDYDNNDYRTAKLPKITVQAQPTVPQFSSISSHSKAERSSFNNDGCSSWSAGFGNSDELESDRKSAFIGQQYSQNESKNSKETSHLRLGKGAGLDSAAVGEIQAVPFQKKSSASLHSMTSNYVCQNEPNSTGFANGSSLKNRLEQKGPLSNNGSKWSHFLEAEKSSSESEDDFQAFEQIKTSFIDKE